MSLSFLVKPDTFIITLKYYFFQIIASYIVAHSFYNFRKISPKSLSGSATEGIALYSYIMPPKISQKRDPRIKNLLIIFTCFRTRLGERIASMNSTLVETVSINYEDFNESFLTCGTCLCEYYFRYIFLFIYSTVMKYGNLGKINFFHKNPNIRQQFSYAYNNKIFIYPFWSQLQHRIHQFTILK